MDTKIIFSRRAWDISVRQAERFFQLGIEHENSSWETAMIPVAYLRLHDGAYKCQLEMTELKEIELVIIPEIAIPPEEFQISTPGSVRFDSGSLSPEEMDEIFRLEYDRILNEFPLNGIFCKQHSHPNFLLTTPSRGDMNHNILPEMPRLRRNGINTMFSLIMTKWRGEWRIHGNALNSCEKNRKLGKVTVVDDDDPLVMEARSQPYYNTRDGASWCNQNKDALRQAGFRISRNYMLRGWRRYMFTYTYGKVIIAIPPFFPEQHIKAFHAVEGECLCFEPLAVPEPWSSSTDYSCLDLTDLASHYKTLPERTV